MLEVAQQLNISSVKRSIVKHNFFLLKKLITGNI